MDISAAIILFKHLKKLVSFNCSQNPAPYVSAQTSVACFWPNLFDATFVLGTQVLSEW